MSEECKRQESVLSAWIDGEAPDADRLELLDHLVRCPRCRAFYADARALGGLAALLREPGAGVAPAETTWRQIRDSAWPSGTAVLPHGVPGWAVRAAAVLLIAVGLAFALFRPDLKPSTAGGGPAAVEVVLEEDADTMTETRFVELTAEVLRADRRFHQAMYRVMEQVVADTAPGETSANERRDDTENGAEEIEDRERTSSVRERA